MRLRSAHFPRPRAEFTPSMLRLKSWKLNHMFISCVLDKSNCHSPSLIPVVLGRICPPNESLRDVDLAGIVHFSTYVLVTSPVCCMNPVIEGEGACADMECGVPLPVVDTFNGVSGNAWICASPATDCDLADTIPDEKRGSNMKE